jgi:hypothetical protein
VLRLPNRKGNAPPIFPLALDSKLCAHICRMFDDFAPEKYVDSNGAPTHSRCREMANCRRRTEGSPHRAWTHSVLGILKRQLAVTADRLRNENGEQRNSLYVCDGERRAIDKVCITKLACRLTGPLEN